MQELLSRISIDPNVCSGIRVFVACGSGSPCSWSSAPQGQCRRDLADYPHVQREEILAAIAYGAEMSRERCVDLPGNAG